MVGARPFLIIRRSHHCSRGLLVVLNALQDFGTTSLMRFDAFTRVIFLHTGYTFDRNRAALALILVGLVLLILWLEYKVRSRATYYSRGNTSQPQALIHLGGWKVPALLCFASPRAALGLVLPLVLPVLVGTRVDSRWSG